MAMQTSAKNAKQGILCIDYTSFACYNIRGGFLRRQVFRRIFSRQLSEKARKVIYVTETYGVCRFGYVTASA